MAILKMCNRCNKVLAYSKVCECYARYQQYDVDRQDKHSFYKTKEWNAIRKKVIYLCNSIDIYSYYNDNKIEYGRTVHHIVPITEDWSKRLDIDNLIYLTESNHRKIHERMNQRKEEVEKELRELKVKWKKEITDVGGA